MSEPDGLNFKTAQILTDLSNMGSRLVNIDTNVEATNSAIAALNADLTALSGILQIDIGTFGEAEPGTILYLLRVMASCVCFLAEGAPPVAGDPAGCDDPLINEDVTASTDYAGRIFAVWQLELPQGLNHHAFLDHAVSGAELSVTTGSGAKIYVQSARSAYWSADADTSTVLPTNTWVDLSSITDLAVSVPAGADLKAFICVASGFFDCVDRSGVVGHQDFERLSDHAHFTSTNKYIPMDGLGSPTTDSFTIPGENILTLDRADCLLLADVHNWTVRRTGGVDARIVWHVPAASTYSVHTLNASDTSTFTIPDTTDVFWIDNNGDGGSGDHSNAVQVEICPPGA